MADCRVAGDSFHHMDGSIVRSSNNGSFHTAVLITQGDFEMKHVLPMALEPEMAGLDDSGVNGTHAHLVNLFAFDSIKIGHADDARHALRRLRAWHTDRGFRAVEANGFEPGMAFGAQRELLGDFTLEKMNLRAFGSQRRKRV